MDTYWTLEAGGVEKSFAGWSIDESSPVLRLVSTGVDVFSVGVAGATVDGAPVWAFEAVATIWRDRVSATGAQDSFSGGSIEFKGKRLRELLDGRPGFEGVTYQFGGPWYDIAASPYQQPIYKYTGDPDALVSTLTSEVVLFQKVTGVATAVVRNSGEQIGDILDHVLQMYSDQSLDAPFQKGTIEPAVNLFSYQARDVRCSEAIQHCLRSSPDAVVYFDYTTDPPTIHVKKQASLTEVSLGMADGVQHESIKLQPREDLQARGVVIYFAQTNSSNGFSWRQVTQQKYPLAGPDGGLRCIVQTVDLQGWTRSDVTAELEAVAVANTRAFLAKVLPEFGSTKVRAFSLVSGVVAVDKDDNPVNLATYPNFVTKNGLCGWMKLVGGASVIGEAVTLRARVDYDEYDVEATGGGDPELATNGKLQKRNVNREVSVQGIVTNGITGTYSLLAEAVSAEEIPTGLAQAIYDALNTLQYDGELTVVEEECGSSLCVGKVLNVTGGRAAWATAKMLIQGVTRSYGGGRTYVTVGPGQLLSAGDFTQLFLINRFRRVYYDPATQASARNAAGSSVDLYQNHRSANSNQGLGETQYLATQAPAVTEGNATQVVKDAGNQKLILHEVVASTGVRDNTKASVELALADCKSKALKVREWEVCVGDPPVIKKALFLSSESYVT